MKNPLYGPLFSSFLDNSRTSKGQAPFVNFTPRLRRLYNGYNHAHAPGLHTWPSPGLLRLAPGPTPSAPKQWKSDVKPCQREIATDEIKVEKNYVDRGNRKARVSALTGSVPCKMARLQRNQHPAESNPNRPIHYDSP